MPSRPTSTVLLLLLLAIAVAGKATVAPPRPAAVPPAATLPELQARLAAHVSQPRFHRALWGVKVVSLDTGRVWFEHDAHRLLSPASNSKLYTAALALDQPGPDYRIRTPILAAAFPDTAGTVRGDVVVSGRGDPSWKARRSGRDFWSLFEPVVAVLERAGVKRITGDLVADATWFRSLPYGSGWTADDLNDWYGAEISAVSLEENYAELRVVPGAAPGQPVQLEWLHPHTGLTIDGRATTGATGGSRRLSVRRLPGENVVYLFGQLPAGGKPEVLDVTVPRPAAWYAAGLKEALARRGIRVEGGTRGVRWPERGAAGPALVLLGETVSPPLRELVAAFMKPSQNLETDLIFGHLGELRRTAATPGTRSSEELALEALREFLERRRLPADDVRFDEGSGLSRNNLTSAHATVALLVDMARHPAADDFLASLPVAGVEGTIRARMKGTAAEGNVRAKTGTLRYANSLSGYVTTAAGERLAFGVMLNRNTNQPAGRNVREEIDLIAVELAQYAGAR
jgi:D-alanyl-D-alanine carboxypeptidase/D-alanyl-D-alanine-endopeptidase (penicillin-binding protein 4)